MAVSLPPAEERDELEEDEPLLGAGLTIALAWVVRRENRIDCVNN